MGRFDRGPDRRAREHDTLGCAGRPGGGDDHRGVDLGPPARPAASIRSARLRSIGSPGSGATTGPPASASARAAGVSSGSTVRRRFGSAPAVVTGHKSIARMSGVPTEPCAYAIGLRIRFRGITERQGMVWRGAAGWAEWSPFLDYDGPELVPWLRAADEAADLGWPAAAPYPNSGQLSRFRPSGPEQAAALTAAAGCRTAKVKVAEAGQTLADDLSRVEAVRAALGAGGLVRVDANGAWDVEQAETAIRQLARFGLEYVEQPCRTVEELAELRVRLARNGVDVLIAADESIRRAEDPLPGGRARSGRHRGAQGAAAGRRPGLPGDRRTDRASGGGVQRAGDLDRHPRRAGPRRGAAGPALRLRAEHGRPAGRRPGRRIRCSPSTGVLDVRDLVVDEDALLAQPGRRGRPGVLAGSSHEDQAAGADG